ncbi:MAG: hypothetical protein H6678_02675 [Candidatus Delongbacteria bacterium]|nr:hypothetical protein [Candidatus Cloacimonadota bacterium]MCB9472694.1 hypothetical protein [Candidatus Delongbacteria bacterium]
MKHSISLSVVLALGAVAAASDMPEKPAPDLALKDTTPIWVKPVVDPSHQAMKQQIEQAKRSGLPIVPAAGPAQHPLNAVPAPSKQERLENWRTMQPLEAYQLFKAAGEAIPEALALQFNASLTVNPYDETIRQAGGSPGSATPIFDTSPGSSYSDSGNTAVLSNYIQNVPYTSGPCFQTSYFDANDAWYTFTLTTAREVTVATCGGAFYYDTRIGVFTPDLDLVTGNDDNCSGGANGLLSSLTCCLDPGTYFVVVDGFSTYSGQYDLTVSFEACGTAAPPTRGGPDAFGYTWINSNDADGPDMEWIDLTTIGTAVTLSDDSYTTTPIPIGFDFRFYGNTYTELYIGSNGTIGFDPTLLGSLAPQQFPYAVSPNNLIAPFWDDLNPSQGGTIHYWNDTYTGRFIVQFTGVPAFFSTGSNTFQVALERGGDIVVQYLDLQDDDLANAGVGIENADGTQGLSVRYYGAGSALGDGMVLRFNHPRPTSGGPDAFGYTWANSNAVNGPPFSSTDIYWATNLGLTGDDQSVDQALPFDFPFYGTSYNTVRVCSNGWLSFNLTGTEYSNTPIPTPGIPDNAIFPLWTDLLLPQGGTVTYYEEAYYHRVIFQWNAIPHISGYNSGYNNPYTFQVMLYDDGNIQVNYMDVSEQFLGKATVGLENVDGSSGLPVAYDGLGATIADNTSIRFFPPQPRPTRGGPTDGYAWVNSLDPTGPEYLWEDISTTGTNLGITADDQTVAQALPFAFPFFGDSWSTAYVSSNGWVSFTTSAGGYFGNAPIPYTGYLENFIAPFWDDLFPPDGGAVYYLDDSANGRVIFQWHQIPHIGAASELYTFQLMLYSNGEIYFNYEDINTTGTYGVASATVGVQKLGGTQGLAANYDDAGSQLANGITIEFFHRPPRPAPISDLRIVPDGVWSGVGPLYFHYEWTPVTMDTFGEPLAVDHYDFYWSLDAYAPFPSGWNYYSSYPASPTPSTPHTPGQPMIFERFVAVDTDGFIVSEDPMAPRISAQDLRSQARPSMGIVGDTSGGDDQ